MRKNIKSTQNYKINTNTNKEKFNSPKKIIGKSSNIEDMKLLEIYYILKRYQKKIMLKTKHKTSILVCIRDTLPVPVSSAYYCNISAFSSGIRGNLCRLINVQHRVL